MTEELKTLYNDNVIVQIVTLPMSVSPRLIRKTRSLLQDDTVRAATVFWLFFFLANIYKAVENLCHRLTRLVALELQSAHACIQ